MFFRLWASVQQIADDAPHYFEAPGLGKLWGDMRAMAGSDEG
jgi:hypothetical protein